MVDQDHIRNAFGGASWLFATTIIQKLLTFSLTHLLVRSTNPDIFGIAAIQLELLLSTLLFLSREGVRLATLRLRFEVQQEAQQLINMSWIPSCLILIILSVLTTYTLVLQGNIIDDKYNISIVVLYCLGALLEAFGEPWYNTFNNVVQIKPKARAETLSVTIRTISTYILVGHLSLGVTGFACAQVLYGATHLLVLISHSSIVTVDGKHLSLSSYLPRYIHIHHSKLSLRDSFNSNNQNHNSNHSDNESSGVSNHLPIHSMDTFVQIFRQQFGNSSISVLRSTFTNSFLKHILTEADKIALSLCASHYNQGVYAVANNYGSLIARVCFLPLEEASRLAFSKMIGSLRAEFPSPLSTPSDTTATTTNTTTTTITATATAPARTKEIDTTVQGGSEGGSQASVEAATATASASRKADEDCRHLLQEMADVLSLLLRVLLLLCSLFPVFGPNYARLAVHLLLGKRWYSEDMVYTIACFTIYILVLGLNGVSEAFVMAVVPQHRFSTLNTALIASSAAFVSLVYPLMRRYGTAGLVVANVFSMIIRILINGRFMDGCFREPAVYLGLSREVFIQEPSELDNLSKKSMSLIVRCLPKMATLVWSLVINIVISFSSYRFASSQAGVPDMIQHVLIGVFSLLIYLFVLFVNEREDILALLRLVRGSRKVKSS